MRKPLWAGAEVATRTIARASNARTKPRGARIPPENSTVGGIRFADLTRVKEGLAVKKLVSVLTASLLGLGLATGAWAQARPSSDTAAPRTDDAQRPAWSPEANAV